MAPLTGVRAMILPVICATPDPRGRVDCATIERGAVDRRVAAVFAGESRHA
jgi:hypothetical protein